MNNDGVKDIKGKVKVDLIPYTAMKAIANVREYGNEKYGDPGKWYNAGVNSSEFIAATIRHLYKHLDSVNYGKGSKIDQESGLPHTHHALCSLALAVALEEKEGSE